MKCPICGTQHNEKFCPNCGQKAMWDWDELDKKNEEGIRRTQNKVTMRKLTGLFVFLFLLLLTVVLLFSDGNGGEMQDSLCVFSRALFSLFR